MLNQSDAKDICNTVLSAVTADDAEVNLSAETLSNQRFAANDFLTNGKRSDLSMSVTVWIDGHKAAASTNDMSPAALKATVAEAEALARVSPVDREYVPTLGPQTYRPTGGFVAATADVDAEARARALDGVITRCERDAIIGAGFHQAIGEVSATATKNGNFLYERSSQASLSVTARTADGGSSGFFLRSHFDINRLDTARIADEAVKKAVDGRNPKTLEPGRYTVILEPQAVADILSGFSRFFGARGAEEGRSPLSAMGSGTRQGDQMFDERINLYSDPWNKELPGSAAANGGLPAQTLYLVKNGVVENLIYSRYWAKRKNVAPTPGPVNAILESSTAPASREEMIAATDKGLLVSRFWYIRTVDPRNATVTGLTRDGVWYIEGGKIRYPVHNFRFNQSVMEMLAPGNVQMIGAPERVGDASSQGGGTALLPPLKIRAFNFTSPSQAV